MYNAFWVRVTDVLKASFFGRLFLSIVGAIGGAFRESVIYRFFTSKSMADAAGGSAIAGFIRRIFFKSGFSDMVSQSVIIRSVCDIPELVLSSPLAVFSCYLIPSSLMLFLRNFGNVPYMVAFAFLFVIALAIVRIKSNVGTLLGSSFVFGGFCRFFGIKTDYEPNRKPLKVYIIAVLLGIMAGAVSFVGGNMTMSAAFLGCLALPLLLDSPLLLLTLTVLGGITLSTLPAFGLSLVTFIIVLCRIYGGKETLPRMRAVYILTALYGVVILYHIFNGFSGSDSMVAGLIHLVLLLFFFSVVTVINNKEKFTKFVFAISACSIITSLYGIYQYLLGNAGTGWVDKEVSEDLGRIVSTFANPNVYGEFLVMAICITLVSLFLSKGIFQRVFFVGCLGLQLINLALTYSRGCYIATVLAVAVIIWFCDKRILGFGIFAIPVIPYVIPQNILARIASVGAYLQDSSVSYRFSIWRASLKIIQNHWYVGSGVGTVAFIKFYQDYMLTGVTAQHSHNWFMQITIEMSIVALVVMLLIFIYAVKDVANVVKSNGSLECRLMVIPLVAAIAGMFFEGLVDYIFYNNIIFMMFWTVIGLLVAGLNICDKENKYEKL